MCYYEDEIWPSRYHDPVPTWLPTQPPTNSEPTIEDLLRKLEELPEDTKRTFSGFQF